MSSTDQIVDAAKKLGQLIAEHESATRLDTALKKLKDDTDAQRCLNDYNRHIHMVAAKEQKGQPIEVDDKRKLEQLQNAVIRNALLRDLQVAQMDYVDLMRRVDDAMQGNALPGTDLDGISGAPGGGSAGVDPAASPLTNSDISHLRRGP